MAKPYTDHDIILFDGQCMLCSRIVRFVIRRDPKKRFRFAALESMAGKSVLEQVRTEAGSFAEGRGRTADEGVTDAVLEADVKAAPDTFMLVRSGRIYMKSRAGLEVVRRLRGMWPLLYACIVVPGPLRDRVYDYIARNRYRWFGAYDHCMLLTPDNKDRFIE